MSNYGLITQRISERARVCALLIVTLLGLAMVARSIRAEGTAPAGSVAPTGAHIGTDPAAGAGAGVGPAVNSRAPATQPAATAPATQPAAIGTGPATHPASQPASSTLAPVSSGAATRPTRNPLGDLPDYGAAIRKTFYVLAGIVGALLLIAKVLPRFLKLPQANNNRATKLLGVVESHRLEPRKSLHLVRVGEQFFLVGSTGDRLELLSGGAIDHEKLAAAIKAGETGTATSAEGATKVLAAPRRSFGDVLRGKKNS